jgi:predicted ATPase
VPLASLADPGLVASAIAQAVGFGDNGGSALPEALRRCLRDRAALLLLDNFEQVSAAAGLVADLVATCPQLSVLLTSRAALGVRGEHEFPVTPLAPPAPAPAVSVQALAANPSVDLFLRRAQAVKPEFTLTPANAAAVAGICRRLEGLPLALELAAARIRVLTPQAILDRLEHRLTFLTRGAADLPRRQRTMREAIAWSYDLLEPAQQTVFRRLAVFDGGCSLQALEAVCRGTGGEPDLLDGVEALHRGSLLWIEETAGGDVRLRMLETVGEYGAERLDERGEELLARRRHAEHFLGVAAETRGVSPTPARRSGWTG